jgi:hypothetical protein
VTRCMLSPNYYPNAYVDAIIGSEKDTGSTRSKSMNRRSGRFLNIDKNQAD